MIYINGRFLTQPMTGVERYAYKMCQALSALGQPFTIVCPHAPVQPCYDVSNFHIIRFGRGNSHLWEQLVLPLFFLGKKNYLLFSFTGLGSLLVRRKVMTIHDLSFLENPRWFSRAYYWWYKLMTPLAARTSRAVITVSNFSKGEILRFYPFLQPERIHVVYGAVDTGRFRRQTSSITPPTSSAPFVLAVSSLDQRKNFQRLIQAFQGISGCQLHIVGSRNRVFSTSGDSSSQSDNIQFLGRVSDDELISLYNRAECFVFPSIYEGFGLPPLEAMACGCAVLAADIPVLREVCADAAIYFNPYDVQSISDAVSRFLSLPATDKDSLRRRGLENVGRFSWEKSAARIIRMAEELS